MLRLRLLSLLVVLLCGCDPAGNCGAFEYSQKDYVNSFGVAFPGIESTVKFTFDPTVCGQSCNCSTIAFIQVVRIINLNNGTYYATDDEQYDRIVRTGPKQGWYLDRAQGFKSPFFKQNDNGTFDPAELQTGSNGKQAVLIDRPTLKTYTWFDAVTVPVCMTGDAQCENRICGYYNWGFTLEKDLKTIKAQSRYNGTGTSYRAELDAAVQKWNDLAPSLGKNTAPPLKAFGEP